MSVALKICGVSSVEDVLLCKELGVEAIGLNLWPGSRRFVSLGRAREILAGAGDLGTMLRIAVVVDPDPAEVLDTFRRGGFDAMQFHGEAPAERYAGLGVPWIHVIRGTLPLAELRPSTPAPQWILLDAAANGYGGTGARTDWSWAARAVRTLAPCPVWLAGGITPANAREAIASVSPVGLDVASGAEAPGRPGRKLREAVAELRRCCRDAGALGS